MGTVAFYIVGSESGYSGTSWLSENGTVAHHG